MIKYYDGIGDIEMRPNTRARSVVVRYRDGIFKLTYPIGLKQSEIDSAVSKLKERLITLKLRAPQKNIFSTEKGLNTYSFNVKIIEQENIGFSLIFKEKTLFIVCPKYTDYNDEALQNRIRNAIIQVMRNEAKRILPSWVKELARKHNFDVTTVKINNSQSRWGSCSSKRNINLSLYCLLLPHHLIELVLLHELCHTVEMNHSASFWQLLDKVTNGRANELTAELKKYRTNF